MHPAVATIPNGYHVNGERWREVYVRPLNGEDHVFLTEECAGMLPAQWVTETLTRCVTRLGPDEPVTREAIRSLTVGDREALLLHLRRLTWGNKLRCVLACPVPECQEKLEFDANVADFLLPPYGDIEHEYTLGVAREGGVSDTVRFRLPTGADQETAASVARSDVTAAAVLLLQQCVCSVASSDASSIERRSELLDEQLSARMAELDPQAEITLQLNCPACGAAFSAIFDTASYLMQELQAGMRHLYREVHLLAYHYHWSASEILGMSVGKRRQFLRLLEEELAQGAAS